jgi:carboxymethylenebutenolidase
MKREVTIKSHDGGKFNAFAVYPDSDLPAPGVIVIQEIFGVNANMRLVTEHLSQAGYLAICPDLFWRQEPNLQLDDHNEKDMEKAFKLYSGFNVDLAIEDLKATLAFIRSQPESTGKVGTVGYCLGGKLAYLMAARSDSDCNISYYGVGLEDMLGEAKSIHTPLLLHVAEKDKFVPLPAQDRIIHTLNKMPNVEVHVYPGVDHAFARTGGANYDKEAAHRANYSTADFLATHIAKHKK